MASHQYWRLYTSSNYAGVAIIIGKLYFYAPDGTRAAVNNNGNGSPSASSVAAGSYVSYAFENGGTNQYQSADGDIPNWVKWSFLSPTDIGTVALKNGAGTSYIPQAVMFQYSDDNVTWTNYGGFTNPNTASAVTYYSPGGNATAALSMGVMGTAAKGYGGINSSIFQRFSVGAFMGGSAALTAPSAILVTGGGMNAAITAPSALASGFGGMNAALTLPQFTLYAVGSDAQSSAALSIGASTAQGYGGINSATAMPSAMVASSGTVTALATAALTMPTPLVAASGTVASGGSGSPYLSMPSPVMIGYGGALISVTIGPSTVQASGTSGSIGSAAITLPLYQLVASGSAQNHGSANLLMPMPQTRTAVAWLMAPSARVVAIGSATIAPVYSDGYTMNLEVRSDGGQQITNQVTHLTNYPYTQIVRFRGSYYGLAADGLYLLEGSTDPGGVAIGGAGVGWKVRTCETDFDSSNLKQVNSVYLSGRLGPQATITSHMGENVSGVVSQTYSNPRLTDAQNYRQRFGKGGRARYFSVELADPLGGDLFIDSLEYEVNELGRKI